MPLIRTDIERALSELNSQEDGMRFQGLAVALAKKRWPELIARPRKKDFGLDAYSGPDLSPDGVGKGLAASITPSLRKVMGDAATAKEHFPDLSKLLFVTAGKIGNADLARWPRQVSEQVGIDLFVIEREELIALLLLPENAGLCASHLYLRIADNPDAEAIVSQVRNASAEVVSRWGRRVAGQPLIELTLEVLAPNGEGTEELRSLASIDESLVQGARLIIEAPAGRGKTTTLIQIAQRPRRAGVVILVDLPAWISSRASILDFVSGMPSFAAAGLTSGNLAQVASHETLIFLLNGWNEIAESNSVEANQALRGLERDFPSAGILVATRTHHLVPPLPGAQRLRLLRLQRAQRAEYLQIRLGERARELNARFNCDRALDEITRTPLVLAEVARLVEAGADVPSTKFSIIGAVLALHEQREEHANAIDAAPVSGQAAPLLTALALNMTRRGAVSIPESAARAVVAQALRELIGLGLIDQAGAPSVLATLTAHHVLERVDYPEPTYQFEHQQLQEYYSAIGAEQQLVESVSHGRHSSGHIVSEIFNKQAWAEPLRMLAEQCSAPPSDASRVSQEVGAYMIETMLLVDPVFAAELAQLAGAPVWENISTLVANRLREIYGSDIEHWQEYALAAMLATGSDEFSDIIEPRLSNQNHQVRLATYRLWRDFRVTSLGPHWAETLSTWSMEARRDFASEILHVRPDADVAAFASADPSREVRIAALEGLVWTRSEELTSRVFGSLDQQGFEEMAFRFFEELPVEHRDRGVAVLRRMVRESPYLPNRISAWIRLRRAGDSGIDEDLKDALTALTDDRSSQPDLQYLAPALEYLHAEDPEWITRWVLQGLAGGRLSRHYNWLDFAGDVPTDLLETLLAELETGEIPGWRLEETFLVVMHGGQASLVTRLFRRMRELWRVIGRREGQIDHEASILRQLRSLVRRFPGDVIAQGVLDAVRASDVDDLLLTCHVLQRVAQPDLDPMFVADENVRSSLLDYLVRGIDSVLALQDFSGEIKAELASSIAQVGSAAEMEHLVRIIHFDIDRIVQGMKLRIAGDRGPSASGAIMRYSSWNVQSVLQLDSVGAVDVLINLLGEPHYQSDAAYALSRAYLTPARSHFGRAFRSDRVWLARESPQIMRNDPQRQLVAESLRRALTSGGAAHVRGSADVACALAAVDGYGSASLILESLLPMHAHREYVAVETLQRLITAGASIPSQPAFAVVDSILARTGPWMSDQERYLLSQALEICAFVENPAVGIHKIRSVLRERPLYGQELALVIAALGESRSADSVDVLWELADDVQVFRQNERAFLNAFLAVDGPRARAILTGFVDPRSEEAGEIADWRRGGEELVGPLATMAERDTPFRQHLFELCNDNLPEPNRGLVARVLARVGSSSAAIAAVGLLDDRSSDPIPYGVWELMRRQFIEERPQPGWEHAFTEHARPLNDLRARLFDTASSDRDRRRSASRLLAQIELWRLEMGRPIEEPRHPALGASAPWPPSTPR